MNPLLLQAMMQQARARTQAGTQARTQAGTQAGTQQDQARTQAGTQAGTQQDQARPQAGTQRGTGASGRAQPNAGREARPNDAGQGGARRPTPPEEPREAAARAPRKRGRPSRADPAGAPEPLDPGRGELHPAIKDIVSRYGCDDVKLTRANANGVLAPLRQDASGAPRYSLRVRAQVSQARAAADAAPVKLPPLRNIEITRQEDLRRLCSVRDEYGLFKKKKVLPPAKKRKKRTSTDAEGGTAAPDLKPRTRFATPVESRDGYAAPADFAL